MPKSHQTNKVITVSARVMPGVNDAALITACLDGEWQDTGLSGSRTPWWPRKFEHEIAKTRWLNDLRLEAWTSSISISTLCYDSHRTEMATAERQYKTLASTHKALYRMDEQEGVAKSFGQQVVRLARIIKADIVIDWDVFCMQSFYTDSRKEWQRVDRMYAANEIDYCISKYMDLRGYT